MSSVESDATQKEGQGKIPKVCVPPTLMNLIVCGLLVLCPGFIYAALPILDRGLFKVYFM